MSAPQYTAPASGGGGGGGVSGSGTAGTVPVWSGSTALGDSPLTVSGTAVTGSGPIRATGTSATTPAFTGSDTDTGLYFPAANQVRLSTAGSLAIAIDSSQRIGIGTASPANRLTVRTGVQFEGITLQEGSANNYVAASLIGSTATNDGGVLGLYYNGVQTVQIFGNGASWFNSGNVAIGTTTPTTGRNLTTVADLDVYGVRVGRGAGANSENVALGQFALNSNTSGTGNTAAGAEALTSNSTGSGNAAFGKYALRFVSGSRNTGLGADAGSQITTGVDNVCIGNFAQLAASSDNNSIVIGSQVTGNGPNTVTIGSSATTDNYFRGVIRLSNAAQGVRLPATPTNSNANTLDCYEEGTWTPTDQSGAGLTFTNVNGTYTRIGRTVIAQVTLTYPTTSSTAHAQISLPIALTTATTNFGGATIGYMSGGTVNNITALIATGSPASSTSNIKFYNYNGAGNVQNSNFSGVLIILTAVYNIA